MNLARPLDNQLRSEPLTPSVCDLLLEMLRKLYNRLRILSHSQLLIIAPATVASSISTLRTPLPGQCHSLCSCDRVAASVLQGDYKCLCHRFTTAVD